MRRWCTAWRATSPCTARDLRGAGEHYAQAVASRPGDSMPHLLQSELLAWRGEGQRARAACGTALHLVPPVALRYWYDAGAALACWVDGALEEAVAAAEQSLRANGRYVPAHCMLAAAQFDNGDAPAARETLDRLLVMHPRFTLDAFLHRTPARPAVAARLAHALRGAQASKA
ncbi:hypothetical protein HK414_24830 [Ramlibacter terrae]|uniref:Tetratricopeptide repeat protein n=1 Tax=Ramlibacter terrae TaxID=2732511 RepID=A0ABX6P6R7_9BURK|nr:hypothetical protein HK414_24830 [Ramlibacter terrae]